jgi:hypothetical protein
MTCLANTNTLTIYWTPAGLSITSGTDATPEGRATILSIGESANVSRVQWHITDSSGQDMYLITNSDGVTENYANVVESSLNSVQIWLPPNQEFSVRYRRQIGSTYENWSNTTTFTSQGYLNSFERYQQLSGETIDPIIIS